MLGASRILDLGSHDGPLSHGRPTALPPNILASLLVERHKPLCLSSRNISGEVDIPAWRVETIDCCGEPLSSAKPVTLMNWRAPRR